MTPLPTEAPVPVAAEVLKPAQISTVARLGKRQDAVCSGNKVSIGFIERDKKLNQDPTLLAQDKQHAKALEVAHRLANDNAVIKRGGGALESYTVDDVLSVNEIVKKLTSEGGPFAGILIQSFEKGNRGEETAARMVVAIHELARVSEELKGHPQSEILAEVEKALIFHNKRISPGAPDNTGIAIALIDPEGNVEASNMVGELSIVSIDADGKKIDVTPSGYKLKPGEKIIIAEKTRIQGLNEADTKGKSLLDIANKVQNNTHGVPSESSISGTEVRKDSSPAPEPTPPHVDIVIPKTRVYENDTTKQVKVTEYMSEAEYAQNQPWFEKVTEAINADTSGDPTIDRLKKTPREDEVKYRIRVVKALQQHLSNDGENADSALSKLATDAETIPAGGSAPDRAGELTTLSAIEVVLENAPGLYDAHFKTAEAGGNPEDVKTNFNEAFAIYEAGMQELGNRQDSLSPAEKEDYAQYLYTKKTRGEVNSTNWQKSVILRAHGELPDHIVQEGIPVEGIMRFLKGKMDAIPAKDRKKSDEFKKYKKLYDGLDASSAFYRDIDIKARKEFKGMGEKLTIDQLIEARIQLEAEERYNDKLRAATNENDEARMLQDWIKGTKAIEARRELVIPKKKKVELGTIYRKKANENEGEALLKLARIEDAPGTEKEGAPNLEVAPVNEDGTPHPPTPEVPTPLTDADKRAQVVVAAENRRFIDSNDHLVDHMMSGKEKVDYKWGIVRGLTNIPLLGGVFKSVFSPLQYVWRNNLAREMTREQNRRFVDRMNITLKSHFMDGVDSKGQLRIPVELTSQLLDRSLEEGNKILREKDIFTRFGWGVKNLVNRFLTVGETAEMHFAKEWLEDNLVENRGGKRDPALEAIYRRALKEQDAVASRIALGGTRRGEVRDVLASSPLETPIKAAMAEYFVEMDRISGETDAEEKNRLINNAKTRLVAQVNLIGKTQDSGSSKVNLNNGIELASNILSVVEDLSNNFGNTGESKWKVLHDRGEWDNFKLNIIAAESRWGGEGGAEKPMRDWRREVYLKMAERELFVGENETAVGVGLASMVMDVGTYGSAFMIGFTTSGALFGANTLSKVAGGLVGTMGMGAVKELGWRVGDTEIFRGRYRGEVAQLSREMALGKKSPAEAKIRGEMSKALVDLDPSRDSAGAISGRIEALLKDPSQLTSSEANQLLQEIAQLDARMRIADISGSKDLQFTVQNYIIYDELQKNEQYLRLKGNIISGIQKLTLYKVDHPNFGGADPITTGENIGTVVLGRQIEYGSGQVKLADMGLFEKFSALAEAQLRVGSRAEVLKWLTEKNGAFNHDAGLGMSKDEANKLMTEYYSLARGNVAEKNSIKKKAEVLKKLALKRAATVVVQSALMMPISGAIYGAEAQLGHGILQEVQHAYAEGGQAWANEWGALLTGTAAPTHPPTIFQEGVLTVRHTIDATASTLAPAAAHDVVIDGVHVQLPGRYRYEQIPQGQPGAGNDRIVDAIDGHVVKDLSDVVVRVDSHGQLIEVDGRGNLVNADALADFRASGINIHEAGTTTETLLSPTSGEIASTIDGHSVQIPAGTNWVQDTNGSYNLVLNTNPNIILVEHAHIGADGQLTAENFYHGAASNVIDHQQNGVSSGINGSSVWDKAGDYRFVWAKDNTHLGPVRDYVYNTGDTVHPYGVEMRFPGNAIIHNPNTGVDESLRAAFDDGRAGMLYNIPGHGQIFVVSHEMSPHGEIVNRLDPSDTDPSHFVVLPDNTHIQAGQFAQLVLNEGKLANHGTGELSSMVDLRGRDAYNLGSNGQSGDIMGAYLDPTSNSYGHTNGAAIVFHEIKGTGSLSEGIVEGPPTITHEPTITLSGDVTSEISKYVVDEPPASIPSITIPLYPIPIGRTNIEKPITGITEENSRVAASTINTPTPTPSTSTPAPANAELTAEEHAAIRTKAENDVLTLVYANKDEMQKRLGLERGKSYGKTTINTKKHEEEVKALGKENERIEVCEKALQAYEKARRDVERAGTDAKKVQAKRDLKTAESSLIYAMQKREGKIFGSPFGQVQIDDLNAFLDEQKEKLIQGKVKDEEDKKKKERAAEVEAQSAVERAGEFPKLTKRFADITEEPVLDHKYVVKKVPGEPVSEHLETYELPETFFVPDPAGGAGPNKNTAPYVFELDYGIAPELQNKRYLEAEAKTNKDSGLFAISAASAENPKEQAKLYRYLTGSIIAVHEHNPDLLNAWLEKQAPISNALFIQYDHTQAPAPVEGAPDAVTYTPRPENEQLLKIDGTVNGRDAAINNAATVAMWKKRIAILREATAHDKLEDYHIRWIEFLAHSVKVPELITKAQSTT
jgi:hypothetical protein